MKTVLRNTIQFLLPNSLSNRCQWTVHTVVKLLAHWFSTSLHYAQHPCKPPPPPPQSRSCFRGGVFLMLSGVLAIATGCFMFIANPYDLIFKLKITFSEGGETFELWRRPPVELYLKAYLFNITNKDAFLSGEEKLRVEQVGPYIYRELISHENVTFNENGTMNMTPKHPLVWVPELNSGSEDDILVLPNIALLSISNVVKDASYFTRMGLNLLIRQTDTHPLVEMTAKEFMFGYRSTLTTLGNKMMPSWITFDKIGLVDRMYDFKGDFATVYTGETDVRMAGIYDTYRGSQQLPQWEGSCGKVTNSSDATKFPSLIQPDDTLNMYRKSICRAMPLVSLCAEGRVRVHASLAYQHEPIRFYRAVDELLKAKFDPLLLGHPVHISFL